MLIGIGRHFAGKYGDVIFTVDGKYRCKQCDATYTQKYNLYRHLREECGLDPLHKCLFCDYRSKRKQNLKTHIIAVHKKIL